jgi:hypothetical protein
MSTKKASVVSTTKPADPPTCKELLDRLPPVSSNPGSGGMSGISGNRNGTLTGGVRVKRTIRTVPPPIATDTDNT